MKKIFVCIDGLCMIDVVIEVVVWIFKCFSYLINFLYVLELFLL